MRNVLSIVLLLAGVLAALTLVGEAKLVLFLCILASRLLWTGAE